MTFFWYIRGKYWYIFTFLKWQYGLKKGLPDSWIQIDTHVHIYIKKFLYVFLFKIDMNSYFKVKQDTVHKYLVLPYYSMYIYYSGLYSEVIFSNTFPRYGIFALSQTSNTIYVSQTAITVAQFYCLMSICTSYFVKRQKPRHHALKNGSFTTFSGLFIVL